MNTKAIQLWLTHYYNYARNTLSYSAADARTYAVAKTSARANFHSYRLYMEQYAAANLTA